MVTYNYCKKFNKEVYCDNENFSCANLGSNVDVKKYAPRCKANNYEVCDLGVRMINEYKEKSGLVEKIVLPAMARAKKTQRRVEL